MTVHDQVVVTGVSEACKYNDHTDCRARGCGCTCHLPPPLPTESDIQAKLEAAAGKPEKACPKCGIKRPYSETFCRIDGERLSSLLCGMCGAGMEIEDAFCWGCGSAKGTAGSGHNSSPYKPTVINVPELNQEVDYGERIARSLQAEFRDANQNQVEEDGGNDGTQRVVEQPAGSQGSFKLVSQPNPNKIRTPERVGVPGPTPPVTSLPADGARGASPSQATPFRPRAPRLPVKPT